MSLNFLRKKIFLQTNFRLQSLELEISDMKECLPFNFLQSQSSFEFQKFGVCVVVEKKSTHSRIVFQYLDIIAYFSKIILHIFKLRSYLSTKHNFETTRSIFNRNKNRNFMRWNLDNNKFQDIFIWHGFYLDWKSTYALKTRFLLFRRSVFFYKPHFLKPHLKTLF